MFLRNFGAFAEYRFTQFKPEFGIQGLQNRAPRPALPS